MVFGASGFATTIMLPNDEQLVAKAPVIVRGTVVRSASVEINGRIWTETHLAVEKTLKGQAAGTIVIRELGGRMGDVVVKVFGSPEYTSGEQVLVFLAPTARGDYQTVDLFAGKFGAGKTLDGTRLWLRATNDDHVTLLDGEFHPIEFPRVQRDAAAFERSIGDRVAGRTPAVNYEIANPVLAQTPSGRLQPSPDFTLLGGLSRWFTFDGGGSVPWVSYGSQSGYTGGGVSEVQAAMAAWNGYTAARINYTYTGATSSAPGGLNQSNSINEILFGDPLAEIAGTWTRTGGGVVGMGGYRTSGSRTWTSPFTADSAHPQGTFSAGTIFEGNLTIQDGVSPSAGLSSTMLAEIIAHEFGHTLGFGHSADSSALMYATVVGQGPSLRADDQTGARWLYPSGGGGTPPPPLPVTIPNAPSSLSGTVSGSAVALAWSDNASNETGQFVYYAASGGGFSRAGDAGANSRSTNVSGFSAGTYRFYVTAYNSAGESSASNTITLTIGSPPPPITAAFRVSPSTTGLVGSMFTFIDDTAGATTRTWNFGDGVTSIAQPATHAYSAAGQYTVTLTASNGSTTSQTSQVVTVTNPAPALNPAFTWSPGNPIAGNTVTFTDRTTGGATAWLWNFGDGTSSSVQHPVKQFTAPGGYFVTLTASRSGESRAVSQTVTIASQSPSAPPIQPFRSVIPGAAQTNGLGGSQWRTELTLFNAGTESATADLLFVPGSGSGLQSRSVVLAPKQTKTYANALIDIFGITNGSGAVTIEATSASSTPQIKVTSRTFNAAGGGTYGQAVPAVSTSGLEQTLYVTGIQANAEYRTNIGFVNRSSAAMSASLTLYGRNGGTLATATLSLAPMSFQQYALATYFPAVANSSLDAATMRVSVQTRDAVSAFASVIDNRTHDPVYIQGVGAPAGRSLTIPAVGRVQGVNNTFWRSDVALFNPAGGRQSLTLQYGSQRKTLSLDARETTILADIVSQMGFQNGTAPLFISWDGGSAPVVTSRTYTNGALGTYGQSVDPVSAYASEQFVTGLRSDGSFRSNVGFLNGGSTAINVQARLLSASGAAIATNQVTVAPGSQMQISLAALFPAINAAAVGSFTLHATADAPTLFAFGSVVDNTTGDPVYLDGR